MTAIEKVVALAKSEVGYLEKASNKDRFADGGRRDRRERADLRGQLADGRIGGWAGWNCQSAAQRGGSAGS